MTRPAAPETVLVRQFRAEVLGGVSLDDDSCIERLAEVLADVVAGGDAATVDAAVGALRAGCRDRRSLVIALDLAQQAWRRAALSDAAG